MRYDGYGGQNWILPTFRRIKTTPLWTAKPCKPLAATSSDAEFWCEDVVILLGQFAHRSGANACDCDHKEEGCSDGGKANDC